MSDVGFTASPATEPASAAATAGESTQAENAALRPLTHRHTFKDLADGVIWTIADHTQARAEYFHPSSPEGEQRQDFGPTEPGVEPNAFQLAKQWLRDLHAKHGAADRELADSRRRQKIDEAIERNRRWREGNS